MGDEVWASNQGVSYTLAPDIHKSVHSTARIARISVLELINRIMEQGLCRDLIAAASPQGTLLTTIAVIIMTMGKSRSYYYFTTKIDDRKTEKEKGKQT